jgi:hypothetical protein
MRRRKKQMSDYAFINGKWQKIGTLAEVIGNLRVYVRDNPDDYVYTSKTVTVLDEAGNPLFRETYYGNRDDAIEAAMRNRFDILTLEYLEDSGIFCEKVQAGLYYAECQGVSDWFKRIGNSKWYQHSMHKPVM